MKFDRPWLTQLLTTGLLVAGPAVPLLAIFLGSRSSDGVLFMYLGMYLMAIGVGAYARVKGAPVIRWLLLACLLPLIGTLIGLMVLGRRPHAPDAPLNALSGAVLSVITIVLIVAGVAMAQTWTERSMTHEVRGEVPNLFPVLVVVSEQNGTRYTAYVVVKEDLEEFKRDHSAFSFLVPEEAEAALHETARYYKAGRDAVDRRAPFTVKQIGAGRQSFEVRYRVHSEAHSVGWYEATAQGYEPKRYLFSHYMAVALLGFPAILIAMVISLLLGKALERWLWSRWRTSTANEMGTS